MRRETKAMRKICLMYNHYGLQKEDVFHKAKMILTIYRDVIWASKRKLDDMLYECCETYGQHDLDAALTYLADFAPAERRQDFESRVTGMFETRWLIEVIDTAMLRVYNYPVNGKVYYEILTKCYTVCMNYNESEILETLNMERSTFYDKKKEAIFLFGLSLWGYAIPELRGLYNAEKSVMEEIPLFFRQPEPNSFDSQLSLD